MIREIRLPSPMPDWIYNQSPDNSHPHRRRFTAAYRRKRRMVKSLWIYSGLIMVSLASMTVIAALILGTTFLSFVILDETA